MSGFSFPPPPPPPPKPTQATSNESGPGYQYSSGFGNGRGRGGHRGGQRGRGQRENGSFNSNHWRGGYSSNVQTGNSQINSNSLTESYGQNLSTSYRPPGGHASSNSWTSQQGIQPREYAGSSPRTAAGQKRKLDALKPPTNKIERPGPPIAPAVPSFGAQIPSLKPTPMTTQPKATIKPAARSLGLNPATSGIAIIESDSEDDGFDEEAMYAELGNKLTFEHNGVVMSLKSQADLAAWKKERQRNWPTKARMVEKDEERRRIGEERMRLLNGTAPKGSRPSPKAKAEHQANIANGPTLVVGPDERANRLDELRKKVLDSEAKNREAKTHDRPIEAAAAPKDAETATINMLQDAGSVDAEDDAAQDAVVGAEDGLGPEASEGSSSETSTESSSESSLDSDSGDDGPEEVSSRPPNGEPTVDPRPPCRFFATRGYCRYGDRCQFKHEISAETQRLQSRTQGETKLPKQPLRPSQSAEQSSSGRKGIFQRLKEQEQEEEDRLALKVIKYLGKVGLFSESLVDGTE